MADDEAIAQYDSVLTLEPFTAESLLGRSLAERRRGRTADAERDLQAAMASGKLQAPPTGTAMYSLSGKTKESARGMWVVLVPGMTAEQTGLPTQPTANGTPWLMRAGTPGAHIHIPQAPPAG